MTTTEVLTLLETNQDARGMVHWERVAAKAGGLTSFGIGLTKLRKLAKQIGRDPALARELWSSDVYDGRGTAVAVLPIRSGWGVCREVTMRLATALVLPVLVALSLLATAGDGPVSAGPTIIGDSVDVWNRAQWPYRARSLDRIDWAYRGGKKPGMAIHGPDGVVRIMAGAGHLRAVDPATAKHAWIANANPRYWNYSSPAIGSDLTAYFGNHGFVQAVDASGKRLWRTELKASWIHRPPALSPDGKTLYVVSDAVGLASLDAATGSVNWLRRDWNSPWASLCFDQDGRILIGTGHTVTCFDAKGLKLWQLKNGMRQLMVLGDRLLGATSTGEVRCVSLRTRKFLWTKRLGKGLTGMALSDDGHLRVTHSSGHLSCLDLNGRVRWQSRLAASSLTRPATALGGDTLTVDADGTLYLVDRMGDVSGSIATGAAPHRWRPSVGPDGSVYITHADQVVRVSGAERPIPPPPIATSLLLVADDFVVDIWVNGKRVPTSHRSMLEDVHGAITERVNVELHEGDWVVFNVVANRMRWGGASYFGVSAEAPDGGVAFASTTQGNWSACDDTSDVAEFIAELDPGADRLAVAPTKPWHDAAGIWRKHLGAEFSGEPIWGTAPNTWIKCIVPKPRRATTLPPRIARDAPDYVDPPDHDPERHGPPPHDPPPPRQPSEPYDPPPPPRER